MATPTGPPSLVPPTTSYRDYFTRAETNTLRGRYAVVLVPYAIYPAAAAAPANFVRLIYAAAQEGVPTAFLKCHQGSRGRGAEVALLHLMSK